MFEDSESESPEAQEAVKSVIDNFVSSLTDVVPETEEDTGVVPSSVTNSPIFRKRRRGKSSTKSLSRPLQTSNNRPQLLVTLPMKAASKANASKEGEGNIYTLITFSHQI